MGDHSITGTRTAIAWYNRNTYSVVCDSKCSSDVKLRELVFIQYRSYFADTLDTQLRSGNVPMYSRYITIHGCANETRKLVLFFFSSISIIRVASSCRIRGRREIIAVGKKSFILSGLRLRTSEIQ